METIFKTDKNGNQRYTSIRVQKLKDGTANIIKATGVVDGKESISTTHVPLGYESALKRAKTIWKNLQVPDVMPMLANKWDDRKKYISEPFYVQPKLDGVRLLVSNKGGISRTGKLVPGTEYLGKGLKDGEYLDGECYDPNKTFEQITSLFKTDPKQLEFYVFDYFDVNRPDLPFEERCKHHVTVETKLVRKKTCLKQFHENFVSHGYEGTMVREPSSIYENGKRSNYLLKFKDFMTEEYEVIDAKTGHGRDANAVVWVCKTENGSTFCARPEGTIEQREYFYSNKEKYFGKMLTVKFQNLTELGIPRFPIGIVFRDYE